ncbi:hypothetical protein ABQE57_20335 [Mycolicibacterium elephantis]|uniref:DUF2867 domain-containing protein n=1 Tax=Mycolicibacterium elephantis TaxID=81858 RepID=A0A1X0D1H6_9MYCO|nr:hypothetical protein [Mycolicibacterium elephantis]ORA65620.1 hypothetical protein BST23_13180 [Mycolicibacterium elephantis]
MGVRQTTPVADIRTVSKLSRIDYADAFLVDVASPHARSAEQWMRVILEDAPAVVRARLLSGWKSLGLRDAAEPSLLGWQIADSAPDYVLLGRNSWIGMPGELLLRRTERGLLFATFVRFGNPIVRMLWAAVKPTHVQTVAALLEDAVRRTQPAGD